MSNDTPRYWLQSVIRIRKKLIKEGKSKTNLTKNLSIIDKLENWLNSYPYTYDIQVLKIIRIYRHEIWYLIPKNKATDKIVQKINQLKYALYKTSEH